jgi:hypothetical protein
VKKGLVELDNKAQEEQVMKEQDLERLEQEKIALEKAVADDEKKHRIELRKWERKIKDSE